MQEARLIHLENTIVEIIAFGARQGFTPRKLEISSVNFRTLSDSKHFEEREGNFYFQTCYGRILLDRYIG